MRPEPIRFVRLDSEHAQSDGKSVNRGLPQPRPFCHALDKRIAASGNEIGTSGVGPGQGSRSPSLTRRIAASGNEINRTSC